MCWKWRTDLRKPYRHLTMEDRRVIFGMINEQRPIDEISEKLGFHLSTIYREIGRNKITPEPDNKPYRYFLHHRTEGYYPASAHGRAQNRRQKQRILIKWPALLHHVVTKLNASWSPQQIAGRLALVQHPAGRISHETIYQYAYSDQGRADGVSRLLPKARKKRRQRFSRKPKQSFVPVEHSLQNRPKSAGNREEFGHW